MNSSSEIKIIGTRHGEKLYETLCTCEEMMRAEDMGNFFRIPADNRDLNYSKYFTNGDIEISTLVDYNSHNTHQLSIEEIKEKLFSLKYIQDELEMNKK
jgi:UDP-glucose 4-epimerase